MKLVRDSSTRERTYGTLTQDDGTLICQTLERPWLDNAPDVSCIPAGTYECKRFQSPRLGYEVFELQNVPNRTAILLHIGNVAANSEGCILLGAERGQLDGQDAVLNSRAAFQAFMASMQGVDTFTLTVSDPAPAEVDATLTSR